MKKSSILLGVVGMFAALPAFAEEAVTAAATAVATGNQAYYAISAALAIGVAALGGALGQGKIGSSAMDGIARNPQSRGEMFVPMIIGLALIESLVIYALVVAVLLVVKV